MLSCTRSHTLHRVLTATEQLSNRGSLGIRLKTQLLMYMGLNRKLIIPCYLDVSLLELTFNIATIKVVIRHWVFSSAIVRYSSIKTEKSLSQLVAG